MTQQSIQTMVSLCGNPLHGTARKFIDQLGDGKYKDIIAGLELLGNCQKRPILVYALSHRGPIKGKGNQYPPLTAPRQIGEKTIRSQRHRSSTQLPWRLSVQRRTL